MNEHVLLIAGGGTIGNYVTEALIAKGCRVDVICLEDHISDHEKLTFYRENATLAFLKAFLAEKHYDAMVNFLHYETAEAYRPYHELLTSHTDQLVFLSSYRIYADMEHPVTENAPILTEAGIEDADFFATESYALGKLRCEAYLRKEATARNWTVVRPVISFAGKRFDLLMYNNVLDEAERGMPILLPEGARHLTAGLDWAGNTGRLIADLLFRPETLGQAYTVSSGQNLTWETVASYYTELAGIRFQWIPTEEYIANELPQNRCRLVYDRLYNRDVDVSRIMAVTGHRTEDFVSIREGIQIEMEKRKKEIEKCKKI